MDSRTEERVKDWDSRPFSSGYEDLRELADDEFSGAVETGSTTLFMLNGRVVGVVGGDVEAFEDAAGTIYEAPHPSLPLLFAMREQGGEERAKYYTNDTPISEADETLSSGSFTGYVELSENVLSGDYYVVYYGGKSMSCAFVGNQEKLITDDEAFDRADDEVGIYTVWDVDVEVTDIPGGDDAAADDAAADDASDATDAVAAGAGTATGAAAGADADDSAEDAPADAGAEASTGTDASTRTDATESRDADAVDDASTASDSRAASTAGADEPVAAPPVDDADESPTAADASVVDEAEPASGRRASTDATTGRPSGRRAEPEHEPAEPSRDPANATGAGADPSRDPPSDDTAGSAMAEVPDEVMAEVEDEARANEFDDEAAWRETTTIPSINPDRTTNDDVDPLASSAGSRSQSASNASPNRGSTTNASGRAGGSRTDRSSNRSTTGTGQSERANPGGHGRDQSASSAQPGTGGVDLERVEELESELESVREERNAVEAERDDLERERDDLEERNRELQSRVETLETEVAELEAELEAVREELAAEGGGAASASVQLSAREALEGTNLFVRYGSKSATTLEDVHDRDVGIADLESNLRLEYHTGFDAADTSVDGVPYDDFLYDSTPYRFVEWFVYDLVFEIRDTGNESDLRALYETFPRIDRIELYGDVSLRYDDGGEEQREQTTFDVVVRDRMGNPLAVANVNDSRDPATEDMMMDLQERASRVKRTSDAFAGAFMVTGSYFDPGALEVAEEATSGSLLSRDSKKSYVKLSRKNGYHLCLVETRNGEFHVNVPEL